MGSDEEQIRHALISALNGKATTTLTLQAHQAEGKLNITYQTEGQPVQGKLIVALVQKHAVSKIKAGENGGRTLTHAQIVQQFVAFPLALRGQGAETMDLPAGFDAHNREIIAFIQNPDTGEIVAAAKTSIATPSVNF